MRVRPGLVLGFERFRSEEVFSAAVHDGDETIAALAVFPHMLGHDSSRDPDEQEFMMAMLKSWEEGKAEARAIIELR